MEVVQNDDIAFNDCPENHVTVNMIAVGGFFYDDSDDICVRLPYGGPMELGQVRVLKFKDLSIWYYNLDTIVAIGPRCAIVVGGF